MRRLQPAPLLNCVVGPNMISLGDIIAEELATPALGFYILLRNHPQVTEIELLRVDRSNKGRPVVR
jgi:hypothetical protein